MRRHDAFEALLLVVSAWLVFLLTGPVLTIPLHIPINYNEGWNAGFDTRAVNPGAGPLYPGPDSFVFNNYPPLGFFIIGEAGRALGDMIMAGRIMALASLLCSACLAGACVRGLGGDRRASLASGLLLLLFACDTYRGYVAMDDPQWLAHALMLAGLALLLRGGVPRLRDTAAPLWPVALSALLMATGGFVKHNLVALPMSTALWLVWLNRRTALAWLLSAFAAASAGLALMGLAFGHVAFDDILHHRRIFRVHLLTHAISRLAPLTPMAAIVAVRLRARAVPDGPPREATVFATLFCCIALVTGIAQRMGEGVYYNAHFETLIALCLACGLALSASRTAPAEHAPAEHAPAEHAPAERAPAERAPAERAPAEHRQSAWRVVSPTTIFAIALLPIIAEAPWHLPIAWHDIADRKSREAAWQPAIARLAATHGPAGCLMLSVCAWAGKPFSVDLFNLTQSVLGGGPLAPFRATILTNHWALFEDDPASFLHTDAVRRLGYDPVMESFARLYTPVLRAPGGAVLLAPVPHR